MRYRDVGATGLRVSEIGFGTGGNAGLMTRGSFEEQLSTVARALELGVNYFDASPDYGDGVSETNLGRVLRELAAKPVITTKVEVRRQNLDDIASHVKRSVEASLARLGVDQVDFVQIHNGPAVARPDLQGRDYRVLGIDDYLSASGALAGLERLRRSGKTRFIGFVCRGGDGAPVRRLIDTGVFQMINIVYTLMNPSAVVAAPPAMEVDADFERLIPYAREHGVGAAIYSPLASGLLTDQMLNEGETHPLARGEVRAPTEEGRLRMLTRARAFQALAREEGLSLAQAAVRFILMEPGVTTVLGGFSSLEQMEEIVAASGQGPLPQRFQDGVEAVWRNGS
jgi:L-glyceraldehyde 3-phosphate reductase